MKRYLALFGASLLLAGSTALISASPAAADPPTCVQANSDLVYVNLCIVI